MCLPAPAAAASVDHLACCLPPRRTFRPHPQAWYFAYFASLSCLFPYFNLLFRRLGLAERQIGLIGAARPFISLPAGSLWSGAADKSRRHRAVLLLTFGASVAARLATGLVGRHGFAAILTTVSLTELFAAPVTIIVDSGVQAGRQRAAGFCQTSMPIDSVVRVAVLSIPFPLPHWASCGSSGS